MAALDARPKEWWPFYSDAFDAVTLIFLSASLTKNNHNTRSLQPPCGASASMGSDATIYTRKLWLMSCTFSSDLLRKWFRLHSVGQCVVPIERSDSPTNNNILLCRISSFILVGIFFFGCSVITFHAVKTKLVSFLHLWRIVLLCVMVWLIG